MRIQSQAALSLSDLTASNGQVMSVTPVPGSSSSYDVAVAAKKSGLVAVSTIASAAVAASTIDVNVDTEQPQVTRSDQALCAFILNRYRRTSPCVEKPNTHTCCRCGSAVFQLEVCFFSKAGAFVYLPDTAHHRVF